jgi:hypothetical protein
MKRPFDIRVNTGSVLLQMAEDFEYADSELADFRGAASFG